MMHPSSRAKSATVERFMAASPGAHGRGRCCYAWAAGTPPKVQMDAGRQVPSGQRRLQQCDGRSVHGGDQRSVTRRGEVLLGLGGDVFQQL